MLKTAQQIKSTTTQPIKTIKKIKIRCFSLLPNHRICLNERPTTPPSLPHGKVLADTRQTGVSDSRSTQGVASDFISVFFVFLVLTVKKKKMFYSFVVIKRKF